MTSPRPGTASAVAALEQLERVAREYRAGAARLKLSLLDRLAGAALAKPADVLRFHEILCFLSAYPDSRAVEVRARELLASFSARADLARFRDALADSGIAGTAINFRFFSPQARWLAERWPKQLSIDWKDFDQKERVETFLPLFAAPAEIPGLDEYDLGTRGWLKAMRAPGTSEAAFYIRRFAAIDASDVVREALWDELDTPFTLAPRTDSPTPSRTLALHAAAPRAYQRKPLERGRPSLRAELKRPPRRVRDCSLDEARALIELARCAMVTRSRDLDAFSYADPRDVRMVDCGGGLAFACIGVIPERRLMLEAVYAFLTLRNGVPIGYVLNSALFGSAEMAYNVFDTYRGAEAGFVYGRVMSMVRHLFGVNAFTIVPYQLGHLNDEAIESGAWWFYRKLGYAPRDRATRKLMAAEEARMKRNAGHRSSPATLRRLARENVYFHLGRERDDVLGLLPLPSVGLAVTRFLAANWGDDRERAGRECAAEAARLLGVDDGGPRDFTADERGAWRRWAPLVCVLPGLDTWRPRERAELIEVIRAKGGPRESDFVLRFDRHRKLREALRAIAVRTKT
jgi:hypothetical protein